MSDSNLSEFKPKIHVFPTTSLDKIMRGNSFAYIDLVDEMGIVHDFIFEEHGIKIRPGTVLTNKDFSAGGYKVAIIFARTRNSLDEVRKIVRIIASEMHEFDEELFELYVRAHSEGFFPELSGAPTL